ncbi:acetyl-CoA carboxylase carboxyl transferase subunit alpha [Pseudofrankia sp. BMG5.37]|uniref:acetyl-CoA carboxylase carboxyl transferase subunit alpha n=1 Tax=Pseudofrankia sp. BMG5.36 TaxID=1834512 RepID=UPI0009F4CEC5|nr:MULTISPECIES: acetyl-CoA carboxylase carboxyl transferase subunit alpha [unclassified Pseudofrankia]MDT3439069.1 acetyl-CoA carboxylase carboxyl transferase subunit alpha [Pseudofrankia sp. BMG5.37]
MSASGAPATARPAGEAGAGRDVVDRSAWHLCGRCRALLYGKRFLATARVCPDCGWHAPLTAPERIALLLDPGWSELPTPEPADPDPLRFTDTRPYAERLAKAKTATGLDEAVLCARGHLDGAPVVVAAMDFQFLGGSLGSAVGEAITRAGELALAERVPLLLVTSSGGARMQEGVLSLMQMAKTSQMLGRLDEAGVLTIALVTDPTFGGVAASFATLCDVIVAEPGARLGFAGPRVIEQTIRQSLPPGFQTAEFLLEHGIVDQIVPRGDLRAMLSRLLTVAASGRRAPATAQAADSQPAPSGAAPAGPAPSGSMITDPSRLPPRHPWDVVRLARGLTRPTTLDLVSLMLDDFNELHGDRAGADCPAMVAGLGRLGNLGVAVMGTQKGHTVEELTARNFGMPSPAGYRKAARVMRLAAKLGLPVVTFIDTAGAHPGIEAEERGQSVAIAENLRLMGALPVPVVALVTGEGGSGGALALAVADRVLMCANAVYSVISPEGCAAILWKDPAAAPRAAEALRVDARQLLGLGVIDAVVPEPDGGSGADPVQAAALVEAALRDVLGELVGQGPAELVAGRHARFRRFGAPAPSPESPSTASAPSAEPTPPTSPAPTASTAFPAAGADAPHGQADGNGGPVADGGAEKADPTAAEQGAPA